MLKKKAGATSKRHRNGILHRQGRRSDAEVSSRTETPFENRLAAEMQFIQGYRLSWGQSWHFSCRGNVISSFFSMVGEAGR
jgi:hypothetical protein